MADMVMSTHDITESSKEGKMTSSNKQELSTDTETGNPQSDPNEKMDIGQSLPQTDKQDQASTGKVDAPARSDGVYFEVVVNDGTDEIMMRLIALKNIFSKQLPKMPREYIVRLVLDNRHISLAICRQGRVIGGICYRPYYEQRFAEIAFCAISATEQVKGYGTVLMNQLKAHVQPDKIEYFLTYADNFAIGYFQKQGFSKHCVMPKERWVGYIKDYDGGTLMECYIHPGIDYTKIPQLLAKQRAFIAARLRENSQRDIAYSPDDLFNSQQRLKSLIEVPGVAEAGWTSVNLYKGSTDRDRHNAQQKINAQLKTDLDKVYKSEHAWAFTDPVSSEEYPQYFEMIKNPIDLSMIYERMKKGDYYRTKDMMKMDLVRMTENAKQYNEKNSDYYAAAEGLLVLVQAIFENESSGTAVGSSATN